MVDQQPGDAAAHRSQTDHSDPQWFHAVLFLQSAYFMLQTGIAAPVCDVNSDSEKWGCRIASGVNRARRLRYFNRRIVPGSVKTAQQFRWNGDVSLPIIMAASKPPD